jgi:polyribonucleotide nucleotidyltransferase
MRHLTGKCNVPSHALYVNFWFLLSIWGPKNMNQNENLKESAPRQQRFVFPFGGKDLIIESGKFAQQASGSVTCRYGDTIVLATVTLAEKSREEIDYFPLMVDYQEKLYAAGKIKTSRFIKREGKPSDQAVLSGRVIDRSLRPLFPSHIANDVQVVIDVLCVDGENDSDIPSLIGASTAIAISDIPFEIVGACRIGRISGEWVLNPTFEARKKSDLDLIVATTKDKVVMLEGEAKEIPEKDFYEAIIFAKKHIAKIVSFISQVQKTIGKQKRDFPKPKIDQKIAAAINELSQEKMNKILFLEKKQDRKKEVFRLEEEVTGATLKKFGEDKTNEKTVRGLFRETLEQFVRDKILKEEKRIGERKLDEIRPLSAEVGILPRTHGSGYFMRGETQVLTVATLGAPSSEQIIEDMEEEYKKRFIHHYNFPPYSVGEVKPLRGPSRRDIGHGALVELALKNLVPQKDVFPYTIRLVSEVLGSNGSSSMASVCASSLALMDAGVPIGAACAGIAMGLCSDERGNYKILTDLQDLEDTKGGMDFKIAGTSRGICACQLDTKTKGLSDEIVLKTVNQAKTARTQILEKMALVLPQPQPELSKYAPRIITLHINPEKIRDVIGPGGKMINEIIDATGVEINIEDDGLVEITSVNEEAAQKACNWIKELTREIKVGEIFNGKITKVAAFGLFVEVQPKMEGLIHISNLKTHRIYDLNRKFNIGDIITTKVIEIQPDGKIRLGLAKK